MWERLGPSGRFVCSVLIGILAPVIAFVVFHFANAKEREYKKDGILTTCTVDSVVEIGNKQQVSVVYTDAKGKKIKAKAILNKKVEKNEIVEGYVLESDPYEVYYPPSIGLKIVLYVIIGLLCLMAWGPFLIEMLKRRQDNLYQKAWEMNHRYYCLQLIKPGNNGVLFPGSFVIAFLCRIRVMLRREVVQHFISELLGKIAGHGQVEVEIVSAAIRGCTRNIGIVIPNEREHVLNKIVDVRRLQIAGQNQIETGTASHGSEIDDLGLPLGVIADKCGTEMLDSVQLGGIHNGFEIGTAYADVKGRNDVAVYVVFPRYINTRKKAGMIYFKAFNEFHKKLPPVFTIHSLYGFCGVNSSRLKPLSEDFQMT